MGIFCTGIHVSNSEREQVVSALPEMKCLPAFVSKPTENSWITVFPEATETQDQSLIVNVCKTLSKKLSCTVLGTLVHDSDIFWFVLCENGAIKTTYDSDPGYFSGAEKPAKGGESNILKPYLADGVSEMDVRRVLHSRVRTTFSGDDIAEGFAKLLGFQNSEFTSGFKTLKTDFKDFDSNDDDGFAFELFDGEKSEPKGSGQVVDMRDRFAKRAEQNVAKSQDEDDPTESKTDQKPASIFDAKQASKSAPRAWPQGKHGVSGPIAFTFGGYEIEIPDGWNGNITDMKRNNSFGATLWVFNASNVSQEGYFTIAIVNPKLYKDLQSVESLIKIRRDETFQIPEDKFEYDLQLKLVNGIKFRLAHFSGQTNHHTIFGITGTAKISDSEMLCLDAFSRSEKEFESIEAILASFGRQK